MTRTELEKIYDISEKIITVEDLGPFVEDRTLIYGYMCPEENLPTKTFHVYIKDKQIHTVVYNTDYSNSVHKPINMVEIEVKYNSQYVPSKRVYPERCDYEFCKLLKSRRVNIPFTTYTDGIEPQTYYGFILEDMH